MREKRIKKLDNKGFTLVELLAVIVVLALIMVFAIPNILDSANTAKEKTFRLYGQKAIAQAQAVVQTKLIDGNVSQVNNQCYEFKADLGLQDSTYSGSVKIESTGNNGAFTYTLYMTNGSYVFNGVTDDEINNIKLGDKFKLETSTVSTDIYKQCRSSSTPSQSSSTTS